MRHFLGPSGEQGWRDGDWQERKKLTILVYHTILRYIATIGSVKPTTIKAMRAEGAGGTII